MKEYGEPDAFGHRKKMRVAEDLSDEIKAADGRRDDRQRPDLRSALRQPRFRGPDGGRPPSPAWRWTRSRQGKHGLMTAISNGCYAMVGIPDPKLGPRRVEVETMYNTERYRPTTTTSSGLPIFLTRA